MSFREELLDSIIRDRVPTVIFGAGRYGKAMYVFFKERRIQTRVFFDNDPRKDGTEVIDGIKCSLPHAENEDAVCIIAVNDKYGEAVYSQALPLGFAMVFRLYNSEMEPLIAQFDDETCLRLLYKSVYHKEINLENPVTFNEKLNWIKLHDRRPEYTTMVDKYAVRKHVADAIGEEHVIPLLGGPWARFDDIDFDVLPSRFVIKCTHDSGSVWVCKDKSAFDRDAVKEQIESKLNTNFYFMFREWAYKDVPPRIIIERFMEEAPGVDLKDYKIFCFNGEPRIVGVELERYKTQFFKTPICNYYAIDKWEYLEFTTGYPTDASINISPPVCFRQMLDMARKLSYNLPFARVDLYNIGGKPYFSEITLAHMGGFSRFAPAEWDERLGSWICLT